jgi:hypothetical protein
VAAAALAVAASLAVTAPRLRVVGDYTYVSVGVGRNVPRQAVSLGELLLCVEGADRATITAVEPVNPTGGFRVEAFAVRPNPFSTQDDMLGDRPSTLSELGIEQRHAVDVRCGSSGVGMELDVQASRPGHQNASSDGWKVSYRSAWRRSSFVVRHAVQLCSGWTAACRDLNPYRPKRP